MKLEFNRGGLMQVDRVLEEIVDPLLAALHMSEKQRTLKEARRISNKSASYFRDPLASLGDKSRLQSWEEKKLARQTDAGWLIHDSVIPRPKDTNQGSSNGATGTSASDAEVDGELKDLEQQLDEKMGLNETK